MNDVDVVIVGAGLSGIGAAYRLATTLPRLSYAILEATDAIGGTWNLFRYPGVRSDSDMFTLGYPFRPWRNAAAIADGPAILRYVRETAAELGIGARIRFRHRVVAASWSSREARWTVEVDAAGERRRLRCRFLYACSGYYSYERAHAPAFSGAEQFTGRIVHPQWWPADLDYAGMRVVIIGSGATAITLVPAMAERAAHVTMVQRSPTYVACMPARDVIADALRAVLPARLAHRLTRFKNVLLTIGFYQFCRRWPNAARRLLMGQARRRLPHGFAVEPHFAPRYAPWDQRLCLAPDADLFRAVKGGKAEVVTDAVASFNERGVVLQSGAEIAADIIVTATGLELVACGGMSLSVDGELVRVPETLVYKGVMLSGVPNFAWCVGYTNASWTLRADLASRWVCRLLGYMERHGYDHATPKAAPDVTARPVLDLSSGYVIRAADRLPKQGSQGPWHLRQNYLLDFFTMVYGAIDDGVLTLGMSPNAA